LVQDGRKPLTRPALNGLQYMQIVRGLAWRTPWGQFRKCLGSGTINHANSQGNGQACSWLGRPPCAPKTLNQPEVCGYKAARPVNRISGFPVRIPTTLKVGKLVTGPAARGNHDWKGRESACWGQNPNSARTTRLAGARIRGLDFQVASPIIHTFLSRETGSRLGCPPQSRLEVGGCPTRSLVMEGVHHSNPCNPWSQQPGLLPRSAHASQADPRGASQHRGTIREPGDPGGCCPSCATWCPSLVSQVKTHQAPLGHQGWGRCQSSQVMQQPPGQGAWKQPPPAPGRAPSHQGCCPKIPVRVYTRPTSMVAHLGHQGKQLACSASGSQAPGSLRMDDSTDLRSQPRITEPFCIPTVHDLNQGVVLGARWQEAPHQTSPQRVAVHANCTRTGLEDSLGAVS